ncbi:GNAT family N-acetyltransferase [Arthrobacter sp. KK5.5]|uniref:GNAT family N-acetyltransferase n=1 Tax=Arthrobacter sp. KK5.5 TaxID=3373084 RepID=UPI003EE4E22F
MDYGARFWPVTLQSGDLLLRPLRHRDRRAWTDLRRDNAEWLRAWEATQPNPGGRMPTFREMVSSLNRQARSAQSLPWAIAVREPLVREPVMAGQLTVAGIMWGSAMTASLGYWVDQARAGQGLAPTAVALAGDHCFGTLGLHRLEINIRPENSASLRVVEKLGFRDEGIRRNYLHIDGRWADHRTFALTSEEVPGGLMKRWLETR